MVIKAGKGVEQGIGKWKVGLGKEIRSKLNFLIAEIK